MTSFKRFQVEMAAFSSMLLFLFYAAGNNAIAEDSPRAADPVRVNGMCLERLLDWKGDYQIDLGQGLILAYRGKNGHEIFVLATAASRDKQCAAAGHIVLSTLQLPSIGDHQWVAVSVDCSDPKRAVRKGQPLIGIFDRANDQFLPTPAEQAWRIDRVARTFRRVDGVSRSSFD